jgi:hypothetical protein
LITAHLVSAHSFMISRSSLHSWLIHSRSMILLIQCSIANWEELDLRSLDKCIQSALVCQNNIREIKRNIRRKFKPDEKIRIILEGLKGEDSISEICRREGIAPSVYYKWSKAFLEAGKKRLNGDTAREANSDDVSVYVVKRFRTTPAYS